MSGRSRFEALAARPWWRALMFVLGALAVMAALLLVALTERASLHYAQVMGRYGGQVLDLGRDPQPAAGQSGALARVEGTLRVSAAPLDQDFNQQASVATLIRHVEMFQWREVRIGGAVHYEMDWVDHPVDATRFEQPHGHRNPGAFPIEGRQFDAGQVRIGGFALSPALLHGLPGSVTLAPQMSRLPPNLAASFSLYQNYLVTSIRAEQPRLGDLRVHWEGVPLQPVTVLARIDGDRLEAGTNGPDWTIQVGSRALDDLLPELPIAPDGGAWRRVLAVLLGLLGGALLLSPAAGRHADPMAGAALGVLLVAVVAGFLCAGRSVQGLLGWSAVAVPALTLAWWRLSHPRHQAGDGR